MNTKADVVWLEGSRKVFKKEKTGTESDEVYVYEETLGAPDCWHCRYKYRLRQIAPCCDCAGHSDTGRSYFQEFCW
jgi:hypothetical protein